MKITLEKEESESVFYDAMCNGLHEISAYGLRLDYSDEDYRSAKERLKSESEGPCWEDVLMQILRDGKKLRIVDVECDGEYSVEFGLDEVHERVALTPIRHLMDAIREEGDATAADCVLQSVFYREVIFG